MSIRPINKFAGFPDCEIYPELMGNATSCLSLAPDMDAGARANMVPSHGSSSNRIVGNEVRQLYTGEEREYAKYMFDVRVENRSRVLDIVEYVDKNDLGAEVLERYYFLEDLEENVIKVYVVPTYQCHGSKTYGYELEMTDAGLSLSPRDEVKAGTIIATVPSWIDGELATGTHANAVIVSNQLVIEDAFPFSERLADKMLTYGYGTHVLHLSGGDQPLFLYGTDDEPRICPDVGERVRSDGILFAKRKNKLDTENEQTRSFDSLLAAVELSDKNLRIPCGHWDHCEFVDSEAEVISVKVISHPNDNHDSRIKDGFSTNLSASINVQKSLSIYDRTFKDFHRRMLKAESRLKEVSGSKFSPELINMMAHSRMFAAENQKMAPRRISTDSSGEALGDYRIEVVIKYPIPFEESSKATDFCGGKGVGSYKIPRELTPYDDDGNLVDIYLASNATMRRNIGSRPFEMYVNAAKRDTRLRMIDILHKDGWVKAWDYLMGFYEVVSPPYRDIIEEQYPSDIEREEALREIASEKVDTLRTWIPSHLGKPKELIVKELLEHYPANKSKINFWNEDTQQWERTVEEHIVAPIYYMRLNKSGREFFANASARTNIHGVPVKPNKSTKARRPTVESTIRHRSEGDSQYTAAINVGPLAAELMDQSLNPAANRQYLMRIMDSGKPRNLDVGYDRKVFKLGEHRIMNLVNHNLQADGIQFTKGGSDE